MKKNHTKLHGKLWVFLLILMTFYGNVYAGKTALSTLTQSAYATAVSNLPSGDTLVLTSAGPYVWNTAVTFTKPITIMATNTLTTKPIINLTGNFSVSTSTTNFSKIEFIGIEFYAFSTTAAVVDSKYFFDARLASTGAIGTLKLRKCYLHGFSRNIVRADQAATTIANITNLLVDSCTFNDLSVGAASYSVFGLKYANVTNFSITNSTFYNSPGGLIYYTATNTLTFKMEKCNIIECGSYYTMTSASSTSTPNNLIHFVNAADPSSVFTIKDCIIAGQYTNSQGRPLLFSYGAYAGRNLIYINASSTINKNFINTVMVDNLIEPTFSFGGTYTPLSATVSYNFASKTIETNPYYSSIGDPTWWKVHSVSINESLIPASETTQLTTTITPTDAPDKTIKWSLRSEDANLAKINSTSGLITTYGLAGDIVVTATPTSNPYKASSKTISIYYPPISSISINESSLVNKWSSKTLSVSVQPHNANPSVSWSVDNSAIATINASTGELTGVSVGFVTVTATANDGSGVAASVTIEITKALSVINWTVPANIVYGTSLDASILNAAITGTSGSASYSESIGTILAIGTHNLTVTFPEDDNYLGASKTVSIEVIKIASTVSWNIPTSIQYGTPLDASILNAIATGTSGAATYSPSIGTVLTAGTHSLTVSFESTELYQAVSKTVQIIVTKAEPTITWNTPAAITYGTSLSAAQLNASVSGNGTATYIPSSGILDAGTHTLQVYFAESDNYLAASSSVDFLVNKAVPTTFWTNPAAITYGTVLSNVQLNAKVDGDGLPTYTPALGEKLNAGTNTLVVAFAESTNYLAATASTELLVNKAIPTVAWNTPESIPYGTLLSNSLLSVQTESNGAATYNYTIGEKLNVGTYTVTVEISESANYLATSSSTQLTVKKALPKITWPQPSSITYKELLSSEQLNASVEGDGIATYNPATGTILDAGIHTLFVEFAESDNYLAASSSIEIIVHKAVPYIIWSNPSNITYGTVLSSEQLNAVVEGGGLANYIPNLGSKLNAGINVLQVNFNESDNFVAASASVLLTVNKAVPSVIWNTPSAINYGTLLSDQQLNATVEGSGKATYTPSVGAELTAGSHSLYVSFDESANYLAASYSLDLVVNKGIPVITFDNPEPIEKLTPLTSLQLNATATLTSSNAIYTSATGSIISLGDVLPSGTNEIIVTFAADANCEAVSKTAILVVSDKALTQINWTLPSAITYGTALSSSQLNATLVVKSTQAVITGAVLKYVPALGSVLDAGTQKLQVSYDGSNDYEAVTKTITIEVDKALLTATAQANTKVYANANPSFGVVYTGFVNGETESVIDTKATSTSVATTTSNVGSYAITVNGASDNNYNFVYVPATLTVTPAALTVTANNQSKSYGATFIPVVTEFTSNGLKNSDGVSSVSLTSAGTVASAVVSSYALTPSAASGSGLSNYSITYIAGSLTVSPAALTITANNESKTYGASLTLAGTEFSSNGLKNSDAVSSVTLTSAGTAASTVIGSYSITPSAAVGTGLSNYTISYTAGSLTVSPAALSVTASNLSKTYGATQTYAGSEFAANGLKNSDAVSSVTLTSAGTAATTSIGSYSITPSAALGLGLSNYTISYTAGSLTVSPATLSVTASNLSKTYGATQTYAGTEFATSGLKNTDAVSSVTLISAGSAATTSAGSYAINASAAVGTGLSNYTISYTDGTLTVSPAALTVSASNQTKTYGATLTLAASGFTASGLKNSDVVSSVTLASSGTTASTVVGSYAITPSEAVGTGLSNYTISYTAGSLTVSAAALTVTASNQTKTYGATQTFVGTEFTTSGLKNSDAVSSATLTSTGSAATSAATTYAITPSAAGGSGLSNYTITYANGTLTVSPAALIVTASNQTKTYGATLTVTGSGVTATGLKNTDAVSSVTLISTGSAATAAVNSYVLTPSAAVGTGLSNYTISYTAGSLTVSPAALTVSASNQTKTYGATLTITGLGAAATGLKNSDAVSSVTLTSTGTAATAAVNSYAITPSAAVGSGLSNYTISYTAGTLTVSPAALTVTANNGSKVYGSALSLAGTEVVATGLKNNDAVSSATLASAGTATTATVGSYAVTPSAAVGTGLSNYTISYTAGSLTVSPAALTVTANNESKVYGSALTLAGTEIVAAGLKNSDAVASATLASAGTATTATVGSYAVTPSAAVGTGLSNYTISYTAGTLTVSPAALTVTANNESKVYGSALSLAGTEVVATGLKNSDAVASATLASAGTATTAIAGSYAINASAAVGTGLSNYTISYTDGTLTVSPAALTVCANNQSKVYGSALSLAGTEVVATGLKNSDAVSSATLTSAGTATTATVGSYAVTPSAAVGTGLSNYTILYTAGTLTVSPAALSISANNESKVYGSALSLAGTEFTATGLKNSDAVSSVTLASTGSAATAAVSNYTITLSDAVGTGLSNYTISYTDGSLTVTKASLKAIATSVSKVYGAALPTYAVSYTGFANNESESVITTKATASSDAKVSSKVGSYAISVSGASASNYSFVYVPATLTITKATLTIAANDTTVQKDKTLPVFTYTVIGLVNDDTEASAFTGTPELTADVTSAKVGDAVGIIVAVGTLSSDNYEFNLVSGTLTIIKNVKVSTANAVDVAVYPNPAVSGNVSVKLASASKGTVSVISLGGAIIANKVIDSQLIDINVDALPVGTYYIRINTENGSVVKTLIKQ